MIARRRRVGVLVPDVPEYLVDNSSMGSPREAELFAQFYRRIMPADVVEDAVARDPVQGVIEKYTRKYFHHGIMRPG